jgi:phosphohistidine phosphatase
MKHLLLLRHGEAQVAAGSMDFERALTLQGRGEVTDAIDCINRAGLRVDATLVSPARRTRETAAIVHAALKVRIDYEPTLYLGAPDILLQAVQSCRTDALSLLLVGHNPGLSELAQQLTADHDIALRTGGLCCITLPPGTWREVAMASASSIALLR